LGTNASEPSLWSKNPQGRKLPGTCRMHGGAKGSGAPCGNRNALKHGVFTKESIERRATLREQIRQAQKLLKEIRG
jgi:uncharacterized protein YjcR